LLTRICARGAKPIGDFGLVYQRLPASGSGSTPAVRDLYQSLPPRRRRRGTGHGSGCRPNQPSVSHSERAAGCHMGSMVKGIHSIEWWHTIRSGPHHDGRCRKEKVFQIGRGRIAHYEHGGKTGMAMIKYPGYRKNAQGQKRPAYPGPEPCRLTVK